MHDTTNTNKQTNKSWICGLGHGMLVFCFASDIRLKYKLLLSIIVTILTAFSFYVGWGAYFAIGNNPNEYTARWGVFDWFVGRDQSNFTFIQR